MYAGIARVLRDFGATIVAERLFAAPDAFAAALRERSAAYGGLDDGVEPTLLSDDSGGHGVIGAQVHAIGGIGKPKVLSVAGVPLARAYECDGYHYLSATGLVAAGAGGGPAQARAVFGCAGDLLSQAGASFFDVARTWIWMRDILDWYGELNQVRTRYFTERGLLARPGTMPASTGIGIAPAGARIGMDLVAAWGGEDAVARFDAVGHQRSAYAYGSAFARAARARTPAGATVFCSGTAAIDESGRTCHVGDIAGQIRMTLDNTRAVLRDTGCADEDVVQALAYCATEEVAAYFTSAHRRNLPWPCLILIGDVCRDDLLFEVEVTACHQ
jgi:enamine deaminase RidA (YjgF/YER057c/UK114 family)